MEHQKSYGHIEDADRKKNIAIGYSILSVVVAGFLYGNYWEWSRYEHYNSIFENLQDGKCKLKSADFVAGWKTQWSFPFGGRDWSNVPCHNVGLEITGKSGQKYTSGSTELVFIYDQDLIPNYVNNQCTALMPREFRMDNFDCAFLLQDGNIARAYNYPRETLPDQPKLMMMRAAGFAVMTLAPLIFLALCTLKAMLFNKPAAARFGYEPCPGESKTAEHWLLLE